MTHWRDLIQDFKIRQRELLSGGMQGAMRRLTTDNTYLRNDAIITKITQSIEYRNQQA